MFTIHSYPLAVFFCIITMLCWGSWGNTQKLASKSWGYPLFYWDYSIGIVVLSLILGLTMGSSGNSGHSFLESIGQATTQAIALALLGGAIFNISNLLLVIAIDIAGMAVAFPIGVGLALVLGVVVNYIATPLGNPLLLFIGVSFVVLAILFDALAYRKISSGGSTKKGIIISIAAGILMGFFYRFVAASMSDNYSQPTEGLLSPYAAVFIFALGIFFSNFIFNTYFMYKPVSGSKVTYTDYFKKGTPKLHLIGMLGGAIWVLGFLFNMIAAGKAGYAISYGLGQGATLVAAIWGVFIWKEFKGAPPKTTFLITLMFLSFILGLGLIIIARIA